MIEGIDVIEGLGGGEPTINGIVDDRIAVFRAHGGHRHVLDMTAPGAQEYT